MSIKRYFDEKLNRECFKVQICRRSRGSAKQSVVRRKVLRIETYNEALKIEKNLVIEAERTLFDRELKGAQWENLLEEWELAVRRGDIFTSTLSKQSIEDYVSALRLYTSHWFKMRVEEIDKAQAWLLLDKVEREVSLSRRKRLRTAIDAVYNWAILSGRIKGISSLPTQGFKSTRKVEERLPEILNISEIRTLLKYAKDLEHPWYPVWALALFTGLRSGELFALEWPSVDFDNRMIYIHKNWTSKTGFGPTKGRYWRAVPINDELIELLRDLKIKSKNEKFVLPRFQSWKDGRQAEILREFCIGSGITSVRFHTLRACFATQLIKDGVAPAVVMKIAGWKDLKTMQRYIRLAGIEIKGATDGLKLLPEKEAMGRVFNLFTNNQT